MAAMSGQLTQSDWGRRMLVAVMRKQADLISFLERLRNEVIGLQTAAMTTEKLVMKRAGLL